MIAVGVQANARSITMSDAASTADIQKMFVLFMVVFSEVQKQGLLVLFSEAILVQLPQ